MTTVFTEIASERSVKAHCGDCYKVLDSEYDGLSYDETSAIDLMLSACERHIRNHPTHNPNVFVKRRELPIEHDLRELKDSL